MFLILDFTFMLAFLTINLHQFVFYLGESFNHFLNFLR